MHDLIIFKEIGSSVFGNRKENSSKEEIRKGNWEKELIKVNSLYTKDKDKDKLLIAILCNNHIRKSLILEK